MPPQAPGSLGEEMTLNVMAYLIQRTGGGRGIAGPHDQNGDDGECGCVEPRKRSTVDGAWRRHRKRARSRRRRRRARRHRQRRSEELRPCDAGDAEESACRGLADLPPQLSRMELQPARSDHARQRAGPEARVGLGDERLGRESNDAHRAQRRHVSREPQQHRPGARRKNRQPHLGNARRSRSGAGLWRHPQHRDRAGQSLSADEQRAHGRAQRSHGRHPVGHAALRCESSVHQRRHRHWRQGAAGHHRLRPQHVGRWVLHQRHRYQHRKARVAVLHHSARR